MMKHTNRKQGVLTALLSALLLLASSATFFVSYFLTRYLPFMLMGICVLMPTALYTWLLLLGLLRAPKEEIAASDIQEPLPEKRKLSELIAALGQGIVRALRRFESFLYVRRFWLIVIPTVLGMGAAHFLFWRMTARMTSVYKVGYLASVLLLVIFVLSVIFDKWCKHVACDDPYFSAVLRDMRSALGVARLSVLLSLLVIVIRQLGFYELQKWLVIALGVVFAYETLFLLLSLTVTAIRRELTEKPDLTIPMPRLLGAAHDLGVLSYLEENTGITMRSLWSMRFIKMILPYTVVFGCMILWFSTGLIQIESHQQGAVYRFGRLQDRVLEPGIHMTLPWPMDQITVYDTDTVRKITVGYKSTEAADNTWTGNHGNSEYKLLLGSGDEVISINLRLEYRISDLSEYLRNSASPEKLLEAKAYELVIDHTISSDLETLLAVDRSAFAADFYEDLKRDIAPYHTGIEVVSVVLESIHPPVEIASVYQGVVSAEIQAQRLIFDAEAKAAVSLADAQAAYDSAVGMATSSQYTQVAQAQSDVAEFMASVSADTTYPDAYRYYKYMNAIKSAYGNVRLIIVGDGVDSSNLYLGNLILN
jgi:regulator of protease activity HflC (stomatin/prohibitin superfamily)